MSLFPLTHNQDLLGQPAHALVVIMYLKPWFGKSLVGQVYRPTEDSRVGLGDLLSTSTVACNLLDLPATRNVYVYTDALGIFYRFPFWKKNPAIQILWLGLLNWALEAIWPLCYGLQDISLISQTSYLSKALSTHTSCWEIKRWNLSVCITLVLSKWKDFLIHLNYSD